MRNDVLLLLVSHTPWGSESVCWQYPPDSPNNNNPTLHKVFRYRRGHMTPQTMLNLRCTRSAERLLRPMLSKVIQHHDDRRGVQHDFFRWDHPDPCLMADMAASYCACVVKCRLCSIHALRCSSSQGLPNLQGLRCGRAIHWIPQATGASGTPSN